MTRRFGNLLVFCQAVLLGAAVATAPAAAADIGGLATYQALVAPQAGMSDLASGSSEAEPLGGTLAFANLDWAEPLEDSEMAEMRGGFGGYSFSLYWAGNVDQLGPSVGNFAVGNKAVSPLAPGQTLSSLVGDSAAGQVFFESLAGSFSNFNGAAQAMTVIGNNIIAQQQMLLNLNIINVYDSTAMRVGALNGLLGM